MSKHQRLVNKNILVIEDDPAQALDLASTLTEAGASVLGPVAEPDDASRLIADSGCDGAILDIRLGDRNATTVAQQLLAERIPFVVCTGFPHSAHFDLDDPCCKLIQKPDDPDRIVSILVDLMERGADPSAR